MDEIETLKSSVRALEAALTRARADAESARRELENINKMVGNMRTVRPRLEDLQKQAKVALEALPSYSAETRRSFASMDATIVKILSTLKDYKG